MNTHTIKYIANLKSGLYYSCKKVCLHLYHPLEYVMVHPEHMCSQLVEPIYYKIFSGEIMALIKISCVYPNNYVINYYIKHFRDMNQKFGNNANVCIYLGTKCCNVDYYC